MKKLISIILTLSAICSFAMLPAYAAGAQSIKNIIKAHPVSALETGGDMSISENSDTAEQTLTELFDASDEIISLSADMEYDDFEPVLDDANEYISKVGDAVNKIDKTSPAYSRMQTRKSNMNDAIDKLPPRIIHVDNIYPDKSFTIRLGMLYRSTQHRAFQLEVNVNGEQLHVENGTIQAGSLNCELSIDASDIHADDEITLTIIYNGNYFDTTPDCYFKGRVLKPTPTEAPKPTEKPTEEPITATEQAITASGNTNNDNPAAGASLWAQEEITGAIECGIVPKEIQQNYMSNITRTDFCKLTSALIESVYEQEFDDYAKKKQIKSIEFTDTNDMTIKCCAMLGIVNGFEDGAFYPDEAITREQAATMLARCARNEFSIQDKKSVYVAFNDQSSVSSWAYNNVRFVKANGIMNGDENDNFNPSEHYTIEQAILTFYRLYNMVQ